MARIAILAVLATFLALSHSLPLFNEDVQQVMAIDTDSDLMLQLAGVPVEKAPACDFTPFPKCGATFFSQFQLQPQSNGFPASPMSFGRAVQKLVNGTGVQSWTQIKGWYETFISCTGGRRNFNGCLDVNNTMTNLNVNRTVAIFWDIEMRTIEYQVGPGFDVLTKNWYCIQNVYQHEGPHIQTCRDHFNQSEAQNPSRFCNHLSAFLFCVERPFARNCGNEVGGLMCHLERIMYETSHPECQHTVAMHCPAAPRPASTTAAPATVLL